MIVTDQPNCFPSDVLVAVSSRHDGSVLDRAIGVHDETIVSNRTQFCESIGQSYGAFAFQRIIYAEGASYELLAEVDGRSTTAHTSEVVADGLFTRTAGVGLMLPVADCVATVVYDPVGRSLALLHLGRHSTLTSLVVKTVAHFVSEGSLPTDLIVWMSPSAKRDSYTLDYFNHAADPRWEGFLDKSADGDFQLDLPGYNRQRFIDAGVMPQNIHISPVDTVTSPEYFSHSAGDTHERFAVLAMMR